MVDTRSSSLLNTNTIDLSNTSNTNPNNLTVYSGDNSLNTTPPNNNQNNITRRSYRSNSNF